VQLCRALGRPPSIAEICGFLLISMRFLTMDNLVAHAWTGSTARPGKVWHG
jgi:hypothetical protein